tara:strand:+ start:18319 stop:18753 length:435 start_codon:yes stop_codon:yes gene_type:complete
MSEDLKGKKIILFDGVCVLCNNFIVFVAKKDQKDNFRFLPIQNKNVDQFVDIQKINIRELNSIVLISGDNLKYKSNAAIEILTNLNKIFLFCKVFYVIPKKIRDIIYDFIANNRYHFFGKVENCSIVKSKANNKILKDKIISDL